MFIMEIVKNSESFNLKDTTELFEMDGCVNQDVSGSLNIHFNITFNNGEFMGDCYYNKYKESNTINFNLNCSEEHRDTLTTYANSVIKFVLNSFKTIE